MAVCTFNYHLVCGFSELLMPVSQSTESHLKFKMLCVLNFSKVLRDFTKHAAEPSLYVSMQYRSLEICYTCLITFRTLELGYMFQYSSGRSKLATCVHTVQDSRTLFYVSIRFRTRELCYMFQYGSGLLNFAIHPITFSILCFRHMQVICAFGLSRFADYPVL